MYGVAYITEMESVWSAVRTATFKKILIYTKLPYAAQYGKAFITDMKNVYSAVRTVAIYGAVCVVGI